MSHQDWKPKFNPELAKLIIEAYGLTSVEEIHPDDMENPAVFVCQNSRQEGRVICIDEDHAKVVDRGNVLANEIGSDWIRALTNTLSGAYPPTLR